MAEVDFSNEKKAAPTPPPVAQPVPPAPVVERVFVDTTTETPLQALRNNVEETIKAAGIPFEDVIKAWDEIEQLDKMLRDNGKYHDFHIGVMLVHRRVQRRLGEATGYKAALAQAVISFMQEDRRK